jgi:hypothetical protein
VKTTEILRRCSFIHSFVTKGQPRLAALAKGELKANNWRSITRNGSKTYTSTSQLRSVTQTKKATYPLFRNTPAVCSNGRFQDPPFDERLKTRRFSKPSTEKLIFETEENSTAQASGCRKQRAKLPNGIEVNKELSR